MKLLMSLDQTVADSNEKAMAKIAAGGLQVGVLIFELRHISTKKCNNSPQ